MPQPQRITLILYALLGCVLWTGLAFRAGRLPRPAPWPGDAPRFRHTFPRWRAVPLGLALILFGVVTWAGLQDPIPWRTTSIALLWSAAAALTVLALAGPPDLHRWGEALARSWRAERGEWLLVLSLLALALLLRVAALDRYPMWISDDEGGFLYMAQQIGAAEDASPFVRGWYEHTYVMATLQGKAIEWLGNSVFAFRLPGAILSALHIPALYGLARTLFNRRAARWSAAILALMPAHVMLSRYGLNQPGDTLLILLAVTFLVRGWRTGSAWDHVLLGVTLALAQFFYVHGLLSLFLLAGFVAYTAWRQPDTVYRQTDGYLLTLAAFFLLTLPYHVTLIAQGAPLLPRYGVYVRDQWAIVHFVNALNASLGAFVVYTGAALRDVYLAYVAVFDATPYRFAALPLLGMVGIAPFFIGLAVAVRRWRDPRYMLPLLFLLSLPLPTLLALPVPHYFRYVLALPFAALLMALGCGAVRDALRMRRGVVIALAVIALLVEGGAYRLRWDEDPATTRYYNTLYGMLADEVTAMPPETVYYLIMPEYPQLWRSAVFRSDTFHIHPAFFHYAGSGADLPPFRVCHTRYLTLVDPSLVEEAIPYLEQRMPGGTLSLHPVGADPAAPAYARYEYVEECPGGS